MTADLEISSTSDFSPSDLEKISSVVGGSTIIDARNETITASTMARPVDPTKESIRMIELKGIEPPFPLVGNFVLSDGRPFDFSLLENKGAVVARILLEDLRVSVGDEIKIGEAAFQIRAVFDDEPGGSSGFRLGARVFIEKKAVEEAGINRNTSRVRNRILYRTSDNPTELVTQLRDALKGTTLTVQSYRETQERLGEQFERTENYLALTGLLILVLGGIGVWNVSRAFIEQKRKAVAVLKCLGASGNRIILVYLFQILTLGFAGSLFGVLLAQSTLWFVRWRFAEELPEKMTYAVNASTVIQGLLLGVLISLIFSALPLLQIRTIKPRLLLRDENNAAFRTLDRSKWIIGAGSLLGLLALAVWQAGSFKVGGFFLAGIGVTSGVLLATAILLMKAVRRIRSFGSFGIRQGINSLYRPGNQTRVILLAVGLGAFVVLTVQSMQSNLIREFDFSRNQRLPSLFFVDVQGSQQQEMSELIRSRTGEPPELTPTIRARVSHLNGEPIGGNITSEMRQQQGQIGREFAVTYRSNLDDNETVVVGRWWNLESDVPEVSVEEGVATRSGIKPGDSITFEISGRQVTTRVGSIRKIDVRNTRTAFVFVFKPGVLESAPQTFAATTLSRLGATERQRLQREAVERFPNVQVFDVADILSAVQRLINNFVIAVSFVGSFVMLSGLLIFVGSIALTKSQRIYENAILKTLGARRFTLAGILISEYGVLGMLAGSIGAGFAVALSFIVSRYLLDIEWIFQPLLFATGIVVTSSVVVIVGVLASFDVLFKKPLSTLRGQ
jgi:putative ABC transport system permease protein